MYVYPPEKHGVKLTYTLSIFLTERNPYCWTTCHLQKVNWRSHLHTTNTTFLSNAFYVKKDCLCVNIVVLLNKGLLIHQE